MKGRIRPRSGLRRRWRRWIPALVLGPIATFFLLVAVAFFVQGIARQVAAYRYQAASACSPGQTGDCRSRLHGRVVKKHEEADCTSSESGEDCTLYTYVDVSFPKGSNQTIELKTHKDVPSAQFGAGKLVVVEYFQGDPVLLIAQDETQWPTADNPVGDLGNNLLGFAITGVIGLIVAGILFVAYRFR